MGLKTIFKKKLISEVLERIPMINDLIKWLTDPNAQGRKRGITTALVLAAGLLRGVEPTVQKLCGTVTPDVKISDSPRFPMESENPALPHPVCKFQFEVVTDALDFLVDVVNTMQPNVETVTFLMGIWAIWDARRKAKLLGKSPDFMRGNKFTGEDSKETGNIVASLLIMALLPCSVMAQTPTPTPTPTSSIENIKISMFGGAMSTTGSNQEDKDFTWRLNVEVPVSKSGLAMCMADWTRTQDSGSPFDYRTFKSIEGHCGGNWKLNEKWAVVSYAGLSWARSNSFSVKDPNVWMFVTGGKLTLKNIGTQELLFSPHHGPSSGTALVSRTVYNLGTKAFYFADLAVPLSWSRFKNRPWIAKFGISGVINILNK